MFAIGLNLPSSIAKVLAIWDICLLIVNAQNFDNPGGFGGDRRRFGDQNGGSSGQPRSRNNFAGNNDDFRPGDIQQFPPQFSSQNQNDFLGFQPQFRSRSPMQQQVGADIRGGRRQSGIGDFGNRNRQFGQNPSFPGGASGNRVRPNNGGNVPSSSATGRHATGSISVIAGRNTAASRVNGRQTGIMAIVSTNNAATTGAGSNVITKASVGTPNSGRTPVLSFNGNQRYMAFQNQQSINTPDGAQQIAIPRSRLSTINTAAINSDGSVSDTANVIAKRTRRVKTRPADDASLSTTTTEEPLQTESSTSESVTPESPADAIASLITSPWRTLTSIPNSTDFNPVVVIVESTTVSVPNTTACLVWPRADFLRIVSTGVFDLKPERLMKSLRGTARLGRELDIDIL